MNIDEIIDETYKQRISHFILNNVIPDDITKELHTFCKILKVKIKEKFIKEK